MINHLPILQVVIPLLVAPLCVLFRSPRLVWSIAALTCWIILVIAGVLLHEVLSNGVISYEIGGWAAPWGIEYRLDEANTLVLLIVSGIAAVVTSYARLSVEHEIAEDTIPLFYSAWMLCITGLLGITATGDAFNVFVFLEISSLSTYAMIAMGKDRRALTASFQYLVMGTIGATFILIGIGLMYMMTGTLNMADLAQRLPAVSDTRTIRAAAAFLTVGLSLKIALLPLHLWLPNAYAYAPSAATALLAATATKVALYVALRFMFTVQGVDFTFGQMRLDLILLPLSVVALLAMSMVAIFQTNVKRLLAYSSVAQIGYMTLGISMASATGLTGSILHIFNHALMKGGLFLALGAIMYRVGSVELDKLAGIAKRMPWTMAAFVAGGLSLIGVPTSVGFISKWYLILAALEKGWWPVVMLIVFTSLLAVIYIWRVIEVAYFHAATDENSGIKEAPLSLLLPTWLLIGASYYFGIDSSLSTSTAKLAVLRLWGGGL